MRTRLSVVLAGMVVVVVGCQLGLSSTAPSASLPTYDPGEFCSLAKLLPATVHVDPHADPPTWVDGTDGAARTNLEWPIGFRLRTSNGVAEVVDPDGRVVARDGQRLEDVGGGASERGPDWFAVCQIDGRP